MLAWKFAFYFGALRASSSLALVASHVSLGVAATGAGVWGIGRVVALLRRSKRAPAGVVPPGGDLS